MAFHLLRRRNLGQLRPLPAAPFAHAEPFLAIQPEQLLVVQPQAFSPQQNMQPPIAEPTTLRRQAAHPFPDRAIIASPASIPHHSPVHAQHIARPPVAHLKQSLKVSHRFPPGSGRYHFLR